MKETQFYHIAPSGKMRTLPTMEDALASRQHSGYCWLDYYLPTKEDLTPLIELLGLHPLSIEDCLEEQQIPKMDDFPTNTFILFNTFCLSDQSLTAHEVDMFIGKDFVVTVSGPDPQGQPALAGIENFIEHGLEVARQGPSFLAHTILDWIVDHKFIVIVALDDELDEIEDTILANETDSFPADLVRLRRETLALRKSLYHEREILLKIGRKASPFIAEQSIVLFRDIYDHLTKFFELTEASRDLISSLMEMYLSVQNNNMTKASNKTNFFIRRLTIITTIFMPLNLVAGIGGMSEWTLLFAGNSRLAWISLFVIMVVLVVATYAFIKWLERTEAYKSNTDIQ